MAKKTEAQKAEEKAQKAKEKAKSNEKPEAEKVEPEAEEKVEKKISKFINHGKGMKVRVGDFKKDFKWITVKHGEIVELEDELAMANGLHKVE